MLTLQILLKTPYRFNENLLKVSNIAFEGDIWYQTTQLNKLIEQQTIKKLQYKIERK